MSGVVQGFRPETMPRALPLFPLTGVLLLPRGQLPLNIFEPRYLNMTNDAMAAERMIGMVQPRHPQSDPVADDAPVHAVGCAGRIVSFTESGGGHILITLAGVGRFRIQDEIEPGAGYRRAHADYGEFRGDFAKESGEIGRPRLLAALGPYFLLKKIEVDWSAIDEATDEALVTALAMICPFAPEEKQALLECPGVAERSELLTGLMEMAAYDGQAAPATRRH